jgi:membrane protein YdbS with pleckstrin-like domain
MTYIDDNLMPQEKVLLRATIHEAAFFGPLIAVILILIAMIVWLFVVQTPYWYSTAIFLVLLAYISPVAIKSAIAYLTTEFAVTNQRVVVKSGLLRREIAETLLHKVESIRIDQSAFGRLFDFGTVEIVGTGGTKSRLLGVRKPFEFRNNVNQVLEKHGKGGKEHTG